MNTTNYEEKLIRETNTIEELVTRICGYGYYDNKGIERSDIERYIEIGVKWSKEHE